MLRIFLSDWLRALGAFAYRLADRVDVKEVME